MCLMRFLLLVLVLMGAAAQTVRSQVDWQFTPGILVASASRQTSLKPQGSLISLEGSRRVSLAKLDDGFSIYHALVLAPESTCGGSSQLNDGPRSVQTPTWRCAKSNGKDTQFQPLKITYDALGRTVTVNSQSFDLSRGNLFVIRLNVDWESSTTRLAVILTRWAEPKNILRAFTIALPKDEFILGLQPH
jgi:hypothetical protein